MRRLRIGSGGGPRVFFLILACLTLELAAGRPNLLIINPMRRVETPRFGCLFNPWANGSRVFKVATTGTLTYQRMKALAADDVDLAARVESFDHRALEEFYDYEQDRDALHNLIDDPAYQDEINRLRSALEQWMVDTGDHALQAFRHRS